MPQHIQTISGITGYRDQLSRARRWLERAQQPEDWDSWNDVDFQDILWACFQNCWHIKDWLRNDPVVPQATKLQAISEAEQSRTLNICQDLCNGTKHLRLTDPQSGSGASHQYTSTTIIPGVSTSIDCMVDDGNGNLISGIALAKKCLAEWDRILTGFKLPA